MTTDLSSQQEPSINTADTKQASQESMPLYLSASQPLFSPLPSEEEEAFFFEEEQPDQADAFAVPFQFSGAMPMMTTADSSVQSSTSPPLSTPSPTAGKPKTRVSLTMVALLVCAIMVIGLLVMNAFARSTPPLQTSRHGAQPVLQAPTGKKHQMAVKPPPVPTATQVSGTQNPMAFEWVPQHLPVGWTNAGLQQEDAIQAIRTAVAFNDREMSLDYRSVGTRTNHAGTFTAATFVMTNAARQRFVHNDVRESSNTLFDMVVTTKLVRLVVDPQPQLIAFAQIGQQQFAWIDVVFQLWQSQSDPQHPQQRIEGKDLNPATNQPRIHHMTVLLLRVPAQDAGTNPAMGGTGWLVSTYALDLPDGTTLDIIQPA